MLKFGQHSVLLTLYGAIFPFIVSGGRSGVRIVDQDAFVLSHNADNLRSFSVIGEYKTNISGWNYFDVETASPTDVDSYVETMKSAGILEGYLTCKDLQISYPNFYADNFGKTLPSSDFLSFIISNYLWMIKESDKFYRESDYWLSVKGSLVQLHGMLDGYENSPCRRILTEKETTESEMTIRTLDFNSQYVTAEQFHTIRVDDFSKITLLHLLLLNSWGDIYSITSKFENDKNKYVNKINTEIHLNVTQKSVLKHELLQNTDYLLSRKRIHYPDTMHEIQRDLRCSSFFKILPDYSDILFGHATWGSYIALAPRIFKHYTLPSVRYTSDSATSEGGLTIEMRSNYFSSSPGLLASLDDFYVISSPSADLAVIETTNDMLNPALHELITPEHNLCWMRVLIANNLARNGAEWATHFGVNNSGTYTNQWQILDMSLFTPGQHPSSIQQSLGLFTLLEEVPGTIVTSDLSIQFLQSTYWASYNIPYFTEIYEKSGNKAACEVYSAHNVNDTDYCYTTAPRALIFKQKQESITNIDDFKKLINYNDWQHDALSLGDSCKSIACRRDLETDESLIYPSGGLDAKVSSYLQTRSTKHKQSIITDTDTDNDDSNTVIHMHLGPTRDNQPVFCWSQLKEQYVHLGQPDCFEFEWITLS